MTDIVPVPNWGGVRQLETNEYATGGLNGNMNEQAKSLAGQNMYSRLYAGLPFDTAFTAQVGGFPIGGKAALENGDIVRSTVANNIVDPNVDMAGWEVIKNRKALYFSDYISVMDGIASNNSQFVTALIQANGREIHLEKGDIIRLNSELNLAALNVNIVGDGKIIIDHTGTGFITTGHVSVDGNIEFNGLEKSWCAFWANGGASKRLAIGQNVVFKNFYSTTFTEVVRSSCGFNFCDGWSFENIRALGNGVIGDSNGVVRAFYIHGSQSFSKIKNGKINGLNTVDSGGTIIQEDADAIHFTGGVHVYEVESIDFQNVGKRWVKVQGSAQNNGTIDKLTGSSGFTSTVDNNIATSNGMYAPVSIYAGDVDIKGLTFKEGVCFAAVTVGTDLARKVTINNVIYEPEYHDYVEKLDTRFVLIETETTNARVTIGSGCYSSETRLGVDSLSEIPYLNINSTNIGVRQTAVTQRVKELHVYDNQFIKKGLSSGTGSAVVVGIQTEIIHIKNNNCVGEFQDGITIAGSRTKELLGSISGNIAEQVTRAVVQNSESVYAKKLSIGANFGAGTISNNYVGSSHSFRNKAGDTLAVITDSGLDFSFQSVSATSISNKAASVNTTNKKAGKTIWNSTSQVLMYTKGILDTTPWQTFDGATVITPS